MAKRKKKQVTEVLPREQELVVSIDCIVPVDSDMLYNIQSLFDGIEYQTEYFVTNTIVRDKPNAFDF